MHSFRSVAYMNFVEDVLGLGSYFEFDMLVLFLCFLCCFLHCLLHMYIHTYA